MTGSSEGLENLQKIDQRIILGDGQNLVAEMMGDVKLRWSIKDKQEVTLQNVKYVPGLKVNLFSVSCALKLNGKIKSEADGLIMMKNGIELSLMKYLKWEVDILWV